MEREFEYRRVETEKLQHAARATSPHTSQLLPVAGGAVALGVQRDLQLAPASEYPPKKLQVGALTAEQPAHTGRAGENQQDAGRATTDDVTGWEAESEILFNPALAFSEGENQPDVAMVTPDIGSIVDDVLRLGKSIEQLGDTPPISDATTKPVTRERKKGIGQKEDDNRGHKLEMSM